VSWPGATVYPWTQFAQARQDTGAAEKSDALRALRRLIMAFRSHSKGRLARFKDKIEHQRMTKGELGEALRHKLLADGVLTLEGNMYFLNPDALGRVVGATYQKLKLREYNEQVRAYVSGINP
jgi:hypothetical protein